MSNKSRLPNFFIVGAAKAGTTSLYYYLKQHPEIYMSLIKEPNFFSKDIDINSFRKDYKKTAVIDINDYLSKSKLEECHLTFITEYNDYVQLFREVQAEKAIGEISNSYLYSKVAAKAISDFDPNAKIVMILRNPIDRAYSHYLMNLRDGLIIETDFIKEVLTDYNKSQKGWGVSHLYIDLGFYYEQVKRYLKTFSRGSIKIFLYDDYRNYQKKILREIFNFLGVEETFLPNVSHRYNKAAIPKYPIINRSIRHIYHPLRELIPEKIRNALKSAYKEIFLKTEKRILSNKERKILLEYFKDDIEKLSKLIDRDLSMWINIEK